MKPRSFGLWRIKLRKASRQKVFVLEQGGKVVARKTVTIKVQP
jgi:hypothetical protein